ncbi:MAG: VanZ family protein [Sphaerospermopsis sp. SIO1G1]|nr:VanZ family protein [Sphaerospermopsis sp. SIO1G1]
MKMTGHQRWVFAFWVYLGILLSTFIAAYLQIIPTEISRFPYYDTILHFFLLGLAAYFSHQALKRRKWKIGKFYIPIAPVIVFFLCIIDEIIQYHVPYRNADFLDLVADVCGIITFTLLAEISPNSYRNK